MKKQLFQPFRFTQWMRLALVGFLAGELGSGGCNGSYRAPAAHSPQGTEPLLSMWLPALGWHWPETLGLWIIPVMVAGLALFIAFIYVSSVMRFVLFDSVLAGECQIREGWKRRRNDGATFFVWQVTFTLFSMGAILLLIGFPLLFVWMSGWLNQPKQHLVPLVLGGFALLLVVLATAAVLAVIHVMTKDFVVPQMALEHISAFEGWNRLWPWIKLEKGGYAAYLGMKMVLAIGAAIAIGIVSVIAVIVILLPIGGAGVAAVLAGKAAGWTWNFYTIALVVAVGAALVAILIFVVSLLNVPAIVFFPAYSMYFFATRYQPLAQVLWPAMPGAGSSPAEGPLIPPLPQGEN